MCKTRSVHAVATSIVFHRVSDQGLPDSGPQQDLKDCNVHQLVDINQLELEAIRSRYRILVAKILFEHFPSFAMFKPYVDERTSCMYAEEMGRKLEVLTMPILMKDEKKYGEVVDVLDQLEKWTEEIIQLLDCVQHTLHLVLTIPLQLEPHLDLTNLVRTSPNCL